MNNKIFTHLMCCLALILPGCSNEDAVSPNVAQSEQHSILDKASKQGAGSRNGATQLSGIGFYDPNDACNSSLGGATFAVAMTGELEGCLYIFVEEFECSPSGTYREIGRELFVGTYNGEAGSFWTTYKFEAKYEGCNADGSYAGAEILGRCQHPIVNGSGEGVFEGVTGRLDMKDDIAAANYPYTGHFKF
jgi:hypothetical protein